MQNERVGCGQGKQTLILSFEEKIEYFCFQERDFVFLFFY